MIKIIISDETLIPPFNEPARDLRVLNKPLWLFQRDVLSPYCSQEIELKQNIAHPSEIPDRIDQEIPPDQELLVYRDNLFFDQHLLAAFLERAKAKAQNKKKGQPNCLLARRCGHCYPCFASARRYTAESERLCSRYVVLPRRSYRRNRACSH